MGMPVKLSDELVFLARAEAQAAERSIASQVEHWARLGRAVEAALRHGDALALKTSGGDLARAFPDEQKRETVVELLETLASAPERRAFAEELRNAPRPIYGTDPAFPGMIVRVDPDGTRTAGRFENRRFVPAA